MREEERLREEELQAIEAYLGDQFSFSVRETAKVFNRSTKWVLAKTNSGQLKAVWLDGQRIITRPTIVAALREGFGKKAVDA
jgi:arsenate reductase-like glutaredoxin family protein